MSRPNANIAAWKERSEKLEGELKKAIEIIKDLKLKVDDYKLRWELAKAGPQWQSHGEQPVPQPQARQGEVPSEVDARIRTEAAQKWGNDFNMQVWEINKQTKAYKALQGR